MSDEQLLEGLVACFTFPLFIMLFKYDKFKYFYYTMIAWFLTWTCRKMSVHIYRIYKKNNNIPNKLYRINIPFF